MTRPALGLIETKGLSGAIQATHAATKAGDVVIASAERIEEDRITVKIEGDWEAVQAAVEAGARAADAEGQLISMHVIPRTDNGVVPILPYPRFVARYRPEEGQPRTPSKPKARPKPRAPVPKPADKPSRPLPKPAAPRSASPQATAPAPPPSPQPTPPRAESSGSQLTMKELEGMSVVTLRKYARSVPGLPIQGRQISMANKHQLLEAIRTARGEEPNAS
jgi:microcompartment protein CcmL/EutN